jgi:hypothetical protein
LTSNEAFVEIFKHHSNFILQSDSPKDIAERIADFYRNRNSFDPRVLRGMIVGHHDIGSYANKIICQLKEILQ